MAKTLRHKWTFTSRFRRRAFGWRGSRTAVNNAVDALVPLIAKAPADVDPRKKWLDLLWKAIEEDDIPYIELLPYHWGTLCK